MTYRTILADLTADGPVEARLDVARSLASRFDAVLIGLHVVPQLFSPLPVWEGGIRLHPAPGHGSAAQCAPGSQGAHPSRL